MLTISGRWPIFPHSVTPSRKLPYFYEGQEKLPGEALRDWKVYTHALDDEIERVLIIGKEGMNVKKQEAEEVVFG